MAGEGPVKALRNYIVSLVMTVVFPLQWFRAWKMAARHREDDPKGPTKILIAIIVSLGLLGVGVVGTLALQERSTAGIYETLDTNLQAKTFEQEFQDQLAIIDQKDAQLGTVKRNLDDAYQDAAGHIDTTFAGIDPILLANVKDNWQAHANLADALASAAEDGAPTKDIRALFNDEDRVAQFSANWTAAVDASTGGDEALARPLLDLLPLTIDLPVTYADAWDERHTAVARSIALSQHHALWERIGPMVEDRRDADVRQAIVTFNSDRGADAADPIEMDRIDNQFERKNHMIKDMNSALNLWVWPSIIGSFYAPVAFAGGSILKKSWQPSETVGHKKYPSGAAGWFLLLGGFGVPALPFAAWTFQDMEDRSQEGQIAL